MGIFSPQRTLRHRKVHRGLTTLKEVLKILLAAKKWFFSFDCYFYKSIGKVTLI